MRKIHIFTKFGGPSSYNLWDLVVHTDITCWLSTDQEYLHIVWSDIPRSSCASIVTNVKYPSSWCVTGIKRNRSIYTLNIVIVFVVVVVVVFANVNMAYILLISLSSICFISITLVRLEQDTDTVSVCVSVCVFVSCSDRLEANCISLPYSNAVIWLNAPYRYRLQLQILEHGRPFAVTIKWLIILQCLCCLYYNKYLSYSQRFACCLA